jgi:DHA1 family tetracycline resistance protein-like MFS transporter
VGLRTVCALCGRMRRFVQTSSRLIAPVRGADDAPAGSQRCAGPSRKGEAVQPAIARLLPGARRWVEPWYLAYALLGTTIGGIAPILLPLAVGDRSGATDIGLVMSALGLGELTAAVWGGLADRWRGHRLLFAAGALAAALGFAGFPFVTGTAAWVGLGLAIGVGTAATNTIANLFVVEVHPKEEWDHRIGWLQTAYNAGLVGGLLLAGGLSALPRQVGLLTAAGLTGLALVLGWATTRPGDSPVPRPVQVRPAHSPTWMHLAPYRLLHALQPRTLARLGPALVSPFALFLAVWFLCNLGPSALYALYPVLMQQVFGIPPGPSAFALALSAGVGIALYSLAGVLVHRVGDLRVLQAGLAVRLGAVGALLGLGVATFPERAWLGIVAFVVLDLAWSLLSVSGTVLASRLAALAEGEAMGLYNTAAALASLLGAALGGWVADQAGYNGVWWLGIAGVAVALGLTAPLRPTPPRRSSGVPPRSPP